MRYHRSTSRASLLLAGALLVLPGCSSEETTDDPAAPPPASQPSETSATTKAGLEAFQPLVGQSVDDATAWLAANPTPSPDHPETNVISVRPVKVDGEEQAVTQDLRGDRLNVEVEGGVITALDGVY